MITRVRLAPHVVPNNPVDYNNKVIMVHSTPVDGMLVDQNYLDFGSSVRVDPTLDKKFVIIDELLLPFEHQHWLALHNGKLRLLATDTRNRKTGRKYTHVPITDYKALTPPRWMAQNYFKILFELPERIYDDCYVEALMLLEEEHQRSPTQELIYADSIADMEKLDRCCREAEAMARAKPQFLKYLLGDILEASLGHIGSKASKRSDIFERAYKAEPFKWEDIQSLFASKVDIDMRELSSARRIEEAIINTSNLSDLFSVEYRRGVTGQKTGNLVSHILSEYGVSDSFELCLAPSPEKNKLYITKMVPDQLVTAEREDMLSTALIEYIEASWKVHVRDIQSLELHKHGPILVFYVKVDGAEYKYAIQMLELLTSIPLFHIPYLSD